MTQSPFPQPSSQRFKDNLELFAKIDSWAAYTLQFTAFDHQLEFCETQAGEPNLCRKHYGIVDYYHSQEGAVKEAEQIIKQEILTSNLMFFYGIGLGYTYEAFEPWLREDPDRHLIYLEDNLEVLFYFLHTAQASKILQNSQVTIFYFRPGDWGDNRSYIFQSRFVQDKVRFLVLPYYMYRRYEEAVDLCYKVLFNHSFLSAMHQEYLSGQWGFLQNFFRHSLILSDSYLGDALFEKFKNIPTIICGAGPSLEKNVHLLKGLADKAIIFAGGSALNVLSSHGVIPHFGVGIDPNPEQQHRLMTNHVFHIPFFYRPRMHYDAFQMIQGPRLYVGGSVNLTANWLEKQLGIKTPLLDEGHNVVHFCTEIARSMGCNPIIYVGMDLAFTKEKTYASGINLHPLWLGKSDPYAYQTDQELVNAKDMKGEPIQTKWDWFLEAIWLGRYATRHPELELINASGQGLGFPPIPNKSLEEVIKSHLGLSEDINNRIHAEIQQAKIECPKHLLIKCVNELKTSLQHCLINAALLINQLEQNFSPPPSSSISSLLYPYSALSALCEVLIQEEMAYDNFLKIFDKAHTYLEEARFYFDPHRDDPTLKHQSLVEHYQFLKATLAQAIHILNRSVKLFIFSPSPNPSMSKKNTDPYYQGDVYQFDGQHLRISDKELGLQIEESTDSKAEEVKEYYSNGQLKKEAFYMNGQPHGSSRFYATNGMLLAEGWFIRGRHQGKNCQYFLTGQLYSIQRYRDDVWDGIQQFFFENGQLHLELPYEKGLLNGTVHLYNAEGKEQRRIDYKQGRRHGMERSWDPTGQLLSESEYQDGTPIRAQEWDAEGHLRKEVAVHQFPGDYDLSIWNPKGELTQSFLRGIEDYTVYYERSQEKVKSLDGSVRLVMSHVDKLLKETKYEELLQQNPKILQDFENLKSSLSDLDQLKDQMKEVMKSHLDKIDEIRQSQHPPKSASPEIF